MRPLLPAFALSVLLTGVFFTASAQAEDASVKARLDATSTRFELDEDGDYRVTYSFAKEKRTQLVFVSGTTEDIEGMRIRQVFSPAARIAKDNISDAKAMDLLKDSNRNKLGSWEVAGDVLYFVIKVPDSIDATQLESIMNIAASTADDMETKFSADRDEL